jgi:hypothetical protein
MLTGHKGFGSEHEQNASSLHSFMLRNCWIIRTGSDRNVGSRSSMGAPLRCIHEVTNASEAKLGQWMQGLGPPLTPREPLLQPLYSSASIISCLPGFVLCAAKECWGRRVQMLTKSPLADTQVHQREVLDRSGLLSLQLRVVRASRTRELQLQPRVLLEWEHMQAIPRMTTWMLWNGTVGLNQHCLGKESVARVDSRKFQVCS